MTELPEAEWPPALTHGDNVGFAGLFTTKHVDGRNENGDMRLFADGFSARPEDRARLSSCWLCRTKVDEDDDLGLCRRCVAWLKDSDEPTSGAERWRGSNGNSVMYVGIV